MAKKFDAMRDWLGIPPEEQPPNHYRLLGIDKFESRPEVIEAAKQRLKMLLQAKAKGEHVGAAKELYEEIKNANKILFNEERKAIYDRLLEKESKKKFVAPSRSARNHNLENSGDVGTTSSTQRAAVDKRTVSEKPVLSTGVVLACLAAMFLFTMAGVFMIVNLGQRKVVASPTKPVVEVSENLKNEPKTNKNKANVVANQKSSERISDVANKTDTEKNTLAKPEKSARKIVVPDQQKNAAPEKPVPVKVVEKVNQPNDETGLQPGDHAQWEEMVGLQAAIVGQVQKSHVSRSGKTRYLYFSSDRRDTMVFLFQRQVGDQLSLDYLKGLEGKRVRVRGKVQREFGTDRIGVLIQAENQIKVLE